MGEVSSIPRNVFLKLRYTGESYVGVGEEETEGGWSVATSVRKLV